MVKKNKKQFIWQEPKPKIRKPRQKKVKKQGGDQQDNNIQQDLEYQQNNDAEQNLASHQKQLQKDNIKPQQNVISIAQNNSIEAEAKQKHQGNQEQILGIMQRLKIIKQILYNDGFNNGNHKGSLQAYNRDKQSQEIIQFLDRKNEELSSLNFKILYIYGSPGTGKTFTINSILQKKQLQSKAKWINCLTMLNKSLFKNKEQAINQQENKYHILVIDEFDQLQTQYRNSRFLKTFKAYLKQILNKAFLPLRQIKFIFIANRSYQCLNKQIMASVQNLLTFQSITQIAFLPYTSADILHILKIKAQEIHQRLGKIIFSDTFLEITSKREYPKSQDIRKVINYIYQHYEGLEIKRDINKPSLMAQQERSVQVQTILNMSNRQKNLFKAILQGYNNLKKQQKPLLVQTVYKQGSKIAVQRHTIDCWLQQWVECGLIKLKAFQKQGHHLYKTQELITQLNINDIYRYFY